ncbi:MAG: class B sortase [Lachnospiraceae bacterium]|nr:class B sortase [Lachnospiraceae bacterium]
MKKYGRYVILLICIVVFLISFYKVAIHVKDYVVGRSDYKDATEIANLPDISDQDKLSSSEDFSKFFKDCDITSLQKKNKEVSGWICIPGTNISYPICQHKDNSYYLTHTYNKEINYVGTPFIDYRCNNDFTDYNTIIYAHRMKDKTMFSALHSYREKKQWKDYPHILIYTLDKEILVYKIYSAFKGDPDGISYSSNISSEDDKKEFIEYTLANAEYNTDITPTTKDSFITLSTCIDSKHEYRMIVHGVLEETIKN